MNVHGKILHVRSWGDFMESFIFALFGFLICICLGSVLNILLKTTKKRDWLITFLISLGLAIIIVPILNSSSIYYFR